MVQKIKLQKHGKGWFFTLKGKHTYHTNENGHGLWKSQSHGNYKQVTGTTQFSLPKDRRKAYNKLYRTYITKKDKY